MHNPSKTRNLGFVVLLIIFTLGLYGIYLMWAWAGEINYFAKQKKHNGALVIVLGIVTCGLALLIWELIYAYDLQGITATRKTPGRNLSLGGDVVTLNVISLVIGYFSSGGSLFGIGGLIICLMCNLWAYCLIQGALNGMAEQERRELQIPIQVQPVKPRVITRSNAGHS